MNDPDKSHRPVYCVYILYISGMHTNMNDRSCIQNQVKLVTECQAGIQSSSDGQGKRTTLLHSQDGRGRSRSRAVRTWQRQQR